MATVGFLHSGSRENFIDAWNAFRKMVPSNVQIKDRYAKDDVGMLKKHAAELANDPDVRVIVAAGGPSAGADPQRSHQEAHRLHDGR